MTEDQSRWRSSRRIAGFAGCGTNVSPLQLISMKISMDTKRPMTDPPLALRDFLRDIPPPEWIREMFAHYRRTGSYRREDLERLLGDPNKRVELNPDMSEASLLAALQAKQAHS